MYNTSLKSSYFLSWIHAVRYCVSRTFWLCYVLMKDLYFSSWNGNIVQTFVSYYILSKEVGQFFVLDDLKMFRCKFVFVVEMFFLLPCFPHIVSPFFLTSASGTRKSSLSSTIKSIVFWKCKNLVFNGVNGLQSQQQFVYLTRDFHYFAGTKRPIRSAQNLSLK